MATEVACTVIIHANLDLQKLSKNLFFNY